MRISVLAVLLVLSSALADAYLDPAPSWLVQPVLNGSSEYFELLDFSPPAPPVGPYPGIVNTTHKNSPEPIRESVLHGASFRTEAAAAACGGPVAANPSAFWREGINHNGASPFNGDSTYTVWRDVKVYGAVGDGNADDSGAFNFAITAWSRDSNNQQTTVPAFVYVPAGTYKISSAIQMRVNTILVGDPLNRPTLIADASLGTNPIIQGYDSSRGLQPTTNFYIGIRNIKLDTTAVDVNTEAVALNWPVSQACQLSNVAFNMPNFSNHIGVTMNEGGSGTILNDLSFTGGGIGIRVNNQQYAFKNVSFNGCHTAIAISHVFVLSVLGASFQNCGTGIDMSGDVGSVSLLDSSATSVGSVITTKDTGYGEGSLVIEKLHVTNSGPTVQTTQGATLLSGSVDQTWVMGNVNSGNYTHGATFSSGRSDALLADDGSYFTKIQPQYEQYAVDQFVNVKDQGVAGDGATDDTAAINAILRDNAGCKIVYFPQGTYLVYDTIYVPPGSRIVGEVWSTISGQGSKFWDANNPQPVIRVGNSGEVGVAEISDMLFTVADVLNGAILMEVNMAGQNKGDVGFWNTHFRVGGSVDSLVDTQCSGSNAADCKATFLMLHVTSSASPYIENMWGWTADHSLDGGPVQVISTGRGALIESPKATWLVGTAFEHNTLYQYNLVNAKNVAIFMQQTETAYWQGPGSPISAPVPWDVNATYSDPDFSACGSSSEQCKMGWAQRILGGANIYIYGSGFWVFFNGLTFAPGHGYPDGSDCQAGCCSQTQTCQTNAAQILDGPTQLFWYDVNVNYFANLLADASGSAVAEKADNGGSWGGVVAAYFK